MKVGQTVRVKNWVKRPRHWNYEGKMDRWCGKLVTIKSMGSKTIRIAEDKGWWIWHPSDFENSKFLDDELFEI